MESFNLDYDDIKLIDLEGVADKVELHRRIREKIGEEDYYGNNLDSLYDALSDVFEKALIVFYNTQKIDSEMEDYIHRLTIVCDDVTSEKDNISIAFID